MDILEILTSAVIIAAAIYVSDWFFRETTPKKDYVDRDSQEIRAIEKRVHQRIRGA
jgi:hypothetical protein